MNTRIVTLTTVALLAIGVTVSAQANVKFENASNIGIDFAAGGLTDDGTSPTQTGIAGTQSIVVAKRGIKHCKKPKKLCTK